MVDGAGAAQALLWAGLLDEMEIHLVPVLIGGGRRLFDSGPDHIELEVARRLEARDVTHLRYACITARRDVRLCGLKTHRYRKESS